MERNIFQKSRDCSLTEHKKFLGLNLHLYFICVIFFFPLFFRLDWIVADRRPCGHQLGLICRLIRRLQRRR